MVVVKGDVIASTAVKNGRIVRTDLSLDSDDENFDSLRAYLKPLVNDFVKRRVLPGLDPQGMVQVATRIKIRESKRTQTVTIEQS